MEAMYVLCESASGYSLFFASGLGKFGWNPEAIRGSVSDLNQFRKMVDLVKFHPLESDVDALNQCIAISKGKMTDELRKFLDLNLPESKKVGFNENPEFIVGVTGLKLATNIRMKTNHPACSDDFIEVIVRGLRFHFEKLIPNLEPNEVEKAQLSLGRNYCRAKILGKFQWLVCLF